MAVRNRNKIFAFVAGFVLLIFGLVFVYVVHPLQTDRAALADELARKKTELDALQQKMEEESKGDPGKTVQLDRVRRQIPEAPYEELLLRDLRLMEVSGGIQFRTLSFQVGGQPVAAAMPPGDAAAAPADMAFSLAHLNPVASYLYPVNITAEFSGSYSRVRRLLEEAETMNRLWQVQNMTIKELDPSRYVGIGHNDRAVSCHVAFIVYYAPGLKSYYEQQVEIEHAPPASRTLPF